MGIFDLFRSKPDANNQQREIKDERRAECPYCHKTLSNFVKQTHTKTTLCGLFFGLASEYLYIYQLCSKVLCLPVRCKPDVHLVGFSRMHSIFYDEYLFAVEFR